MEITSFIIIGIFSKKKKKKKETAPRHFIPRLGEPKPYVPQQVEVKTERQVEIGSCSESRPETGAYFCPFSKWGSSGT